MVEQLLTYDGLLLRDSVLHAAETGNIKLTEVLLDALEFIDPNLEFAGYLESTEYAEGMTPIMVAAQNGKFELVEMMLKRGHFIYRPHLPTCLCKMCKMAMKISGVHVAYTRLSSYRAICNPVYITQTSSDPILVAFQLDRELKKCAHLDFEFKKEYLELASEVREFAVDLLKQCPSLNDVPTLLTISRGFKENAGNFPFPRLSMALDLKQKEFVAHSSVQQIVQTEWLGAMFLWPRQRFSEKCFEVFMRLLLLPIIVCIYSLIPKAKFLRKWKCPVGRYISDFNCYILFLTCNVMMLNLDATRATKGPPRTGFEFFVVLWIMGSLLSTLKCMWIQRPSRFFSTPWQVYDLVMQLLYCVVFILWLLSHFERNQDQARKYWKQSDKTLVHEMLSVCGLFMTFFRVFFYAYQSQLLGPIQVSMGKMLSAIASFYMFLFWVQITYASGLVRLYYYYDGMTQTQPDGSVKEQLSDLTRFWAALKTLYWAMFNMSPKQSPDIIIDNKGGEETINKHSMTELMGTIIFGSYHSLTEIIFFNIFVAWLSNIYSRIIDNADVEWKFERTKQCLRFFNEKPVLAPPFNLIPGLGLLGGPDENDGPIIAQFKKKRGDVDEWTQYKNLMTIIVERYLRSKAIEHDINPEDYGFWDDEE